MEAQTNFLKFKIDSRPSIFHASMFNDKISKSLRVNSYLTSDYLSFIQSKICLMIINI